MKPHNKTLSAISKSLPLLFALGAAAAAYYADRELFVPALVAVASGLVTLFLKRYRLNETGHIKLEMVELIRKNIVRQQWILMLILLACASVILVTAYISLAGFLLLTAVAALTLDLELFSSNAGKFIDEHLLTLSKRGITIPEIGKLFGLKASSFVVFEKSTAVFAGRQKVSSIIPIRELSGETCLSLAYALTMGQENTVTEAIKEEAKKIKVEPLEVLDIQSRPDIGGVEGTLLGRRVLMGNARFMAENKVDLLPVSNFIKVTAEAHEIAVFLAIEDKVEGLIALKDELLPDVGRVLHYLRRRKVRTVLLTNDSTALGEQLKKDLGFDEVAANKTAPEKNEYVSNLRNSGREVLFVTKPSSQTGRTKHDVLVLLLDHEPKIAMVPNEISTKNGLTDMIYLFEVADELHAGIFKSNKTLIVYSVVAALAAGAAYLINPYAGIGAGAVIRFFDLPLYRKLVTTLEKYVRNI